MTSSFAIDAHGLVKRYGAKTALGGIDLAVPTGTVTAVLGPNGAGKTTAVRILTTLADADEGTATVAGFDVAHHANEVRRRIGLAAQDATVDPLLTGRENLVMIGELHQIRRADARRRAELLLEQFDLVDAADRVASGYSGGMRRRLDLAATLVANPQVLFLDEPTTGLDTLVGQGTTLMLTTQYLEEADRLADDIVVIDHGRIIARGDARSLKRQVGGDNIGVTLADTAQLEAVAGLLAGCTDAQPIIDRPLRTVTVPTGEGVAGLATVARALADAGITVEDLSLRQPTLDEVFLTLTGEAIDHEDDDALQETRA
jgi:ABC-2 type transport system ATP-binding protein